MTVIDFPSDLDSEIIIRQLHRAGIKDFVLIGYDRDGMECIVTDLEDGGDILWHLRRTEHKLMSSADGIVVSPENSA
jgi:hypothetical protein